MICEPCKEAGKLLLKLRDDSLWQMLDDLLDEGLVVEVFPKHLVEAEIKLLYKQCRGSTWCDNQKRGLDEREYLNLRLIEEIEQLAA